MFLAIAPRWRGKEATLEKAERKAIGAATERAERETCSARRQVCKFAMSSSPKRPAVPAALDLIGAEGRPTAWLA